MFVMEGAPALMRGYRPVRHQDLVGVAMVDHLGQISRKKDRRFEFVLDRTAAYEEVECDVASFCGGRLSEVLKSSLPSGRRAGGDDGFLLVVAIRLRVRDQTRRLIIASAAAVEEQGHQANPDHQRENDANRHRDVSGCRHLNGAKGEAFIGNEAGKAQQRDQG
jgi:hypothetical protein